jgi:uncharacterized protein YndB with AHSA1/START domain
MVHATGIVRASVEAVFDAWVNPAIRRKWWRNVRGEGPTVCEIDARVGGRYTIKQLGSGSESADIHDSYEWVMTGEFLEVDRPVRLVFTWNVNNPDEPVVNQRVTVSFQAADGGTKVDVTHEGIGSTGLRDGTQAGWETMIDHIKDVLEESGN